MRTTIKLAAALTASLAAFCCQGALLAQQTGTIPVASVVRAGNSTSSKLNVRMAGSIIAGGKRMMLDFEGASTTTESFGAKDAQGLFPLTSTTTFSYLKGTLDGKPISVPITALPAVVLKIDDKGEIKSADAPSAAQGEIWKQQALEMARNAAITRPPAGAFTLNTAITKVIQFPVAGSTARVQVSFLPTAIAEVGGEQAVKLQITANSNFDHKVTQVVNGQAVTVTTNGTISMTGGMSVGLATGEVIRQSVTQSTVGTISAGGQQTALQLRTVNEGYRVKQ